MSTAWKVTLYSAAALTLVLCGLGALLVMAVSSPNGCAIPLAATTPTAAAGGWSDDQVGNAATIVEVGAGLDVPRFGAVIAVATALQESGLRNLGDLGAANDHDSLGLFQQRPSQGWGTPAQVLDPVYASTRFYQALVRVPGWQQMTVTEAAQRVQRSAFPQAYAKWEPAARVLVADVAARLGLPADCDTAQTGWVLPVPAGTYRLTSPYGPRWGSFHAGQDFAAPAGTPIRAAASGTVVEADCTSPFCDRPGNVDAQGNPTTPGCGLTVKILHNAGIATAYCHARALAVHTGQTVAAGEVIGWVGTTGNSTGNHLHFQIHVAAPPIDNSTVVDPVGYLASVGVAV